MKFSIRFLIYVILLWKFIIIILISIDLNNSFLLKLLLTNKKNYILFKINNYL